MRIRIFFCALVIALPALAAKHEQVEFQTSDRCVACHNQLKTPSGEDVSIGLNWQSSVMANSSHDPYWQASVRRETIDHAQAIDKIQDECTICHMPVTTYSARLRGKEGRMFEHFPFDQDKKEGKAASDGVDCSVCHQITPEKLGTRESFNGGYVIGKSQIPGEHPEYGPFQIDEGQLRIMRTSTGGFQPTENMDQIKKSELCATCHTLYTTAFGPGGQEVGSLPEQMPYQEWLNSDYKDQKSCQDCHMPTVMEQTPITRVFGVPRDGMKRHVFVGGNFFLQRELSVHRDELEVTALPEQLSAAAQYTISYLKNQAARISVGNVRVTGGNLQAEVFVENLGGHKLPTAYPSRRSWLHVTVRDRNDRVIFESGALRPDGSIVGNDNDTDPQRYEPHYTEITNSEQVQIYEDIMAGQDGKITTGLLTAVRYVKDNRLLPHGFNKQAAEKDIAVIGEAASDPNFTAEGSRVRYSVNVGGATGPLRVVAELWYQPIGFRWAHNLEPYQAQPEPRRFLGFFNSMSTGTAEMLASASVSANP